MDANAHKSLNVEQNGQSKNILTKRIFCRFHTAMASQTRTDNDAQLET